MGKDIKLLDPSQCRQTSPRPRRHPIHLKVSQHQPLSTPDPLLSLLLFALEASLHCIQHRLNRWNSLRREIFSDHELHLRRIPDLTPIYRGTPRMTRTCNIGKSLCARTCSTISTQGRISCITRLLVHPKTRAQSR